MFFASWKTSTAQWRMAPGSSRAAGDLAVYSNANANQSTPGFVDTSNVSSDSNNFLYWYCVTLMFVFLNAQLTSLVHFGVGVLLMVLQVINVSLQ